MHVLESPTVSLEEKSKAMATLKLWKVIERRCAVLVYITDPNNLVRERYIQQEEIKLE